MPPRILLLPQAVSWRLHNSDAGGKANRRPTAGMVTVLCQGQDYRAGARDEVAALLRGRMDRLIDDHLERMISLGAPQRRPSGCARATAQLSNCARHVHGGFARAAHPEFAATLGLHHRRGGIVRNARVKRRAIQCPSLGNRSAIGLHMYCMCASTLIGRDDVERWQRSYATRQALGQSPGLQDLVR